ncbi:TonB system transport protein ExbD [Acinetobacter rathckeae]|uniref:TonB system transport protein ExbD n=1 Tax=Acinetobacter rathckeae TaxID=2605272 RepID=UPI0018A30B73|nr:TonB system transport protein ExbD [Acinetobacter rathckeae]MBF7689019.1 TonB system transport protein ExbD [Acinetobacter rathckeae]MBF7696539.1 TonB system transport protein ExbD [Acinetobacter rathckeae]
MKRNRSRDILEESHNINITPFIDVMLVLLIIFMVVAPLSTVNVPIDLPASTEKKQQEPTNPIYVTIKKDLSLALNDSSIDSSQLTKTLDLLSHNNHDERIFLRADKSISYESVMNTINVLRQAGYLKVALVGLDGSSI